MNKFEEQNDKLNYLGAAFENTCACVIGTDKLYSLRESLGKRIHNKRIENYAELAKELGFNDVADEFLALRNPIE